ncbi:MAG TPA: FAD-dependent oxidoreductase [Vicinamibacterales bacterium]|nr:FAD-dependent oxidoreductase [Vicinamibacterales bacterium]
MSNPSDASARTDLTKGVKAAALAAGEMLAGSVGDEEVVLVRAADRFFAVGARCTHYRGALADGLVVDSTVRCPLHHACFDLRSGEALRAPALDPIPCWRVEQQGDLVFVREKLSQVGTPTSQRAAAPGGQRSLWPSSVIIVGGGAAGLAAADVLRREGYDRPITIVSADADPPVDRPNLSKDYLAGEAQDDWIPLWPPDFYEDRRVDLLLRSPVSSIDLSSRTVGLENGQRREFGSLLIATGADPVKLSIPGADGPQILYLRSFADSRAIVEKTKTAKHVVVIGASFIGLEVAASLRARAIGVDVVAPGRVPLERAMGAEVGRFIQSLHEAKGVVFHLGENVTAVSGRAVKLSGGATLEADFVVAGVGVRPATRLAENAGLTVDRGIAVNEYLQTSAPGIFAAGDVARWPDPHTGERIRVEHWVVAERQGQVAARNILGFHARFDAVPFFWSQHYDVTIKYVGHAEHWDAVKIDGTLDARSWSVSYLRGGRRLAVATVSRDRDSLQAEVELERVAASH